jgi:hypothetical protein
MRVNVGVLESGVPGSLTAVKRVNIRLNKEPLLIIQLVLPSGACERFGDVVGHVA